MPKTHRAKPLYQRGNYRLDRRPDRANLVITRYDAERKRERISSAGTSDVEIAMRNLDALYLSETQGASVCPTCGQPRIGTGSAFVTTAIADYLVDHGERQSSSEAIRHRLTHVVRYCATLPTVPTCDAIDGNWIADFRRWAMAQPIISPKGAVRQRSLATVENSVSQLVAVINWAFGRGDTRRRAQFKAHRPEAVSRTPSLRADVSMLASMFEYATDPIWGGRRTNLLRFLRASIVTLARPDAAHDISTAPERDQWNSQRRILNLNPKGRAQTKKRRATVPIARQVAVEFDAIEAARLAEIERRQHRARNAAPDPRDTFDVSGLYIPVNSIKSAFATMMTDLKLQGDGQGGIKLIRRSMADLVRERLDEAHISELEMFLGHRVVNSTTELYAPFKPTYLRRVLAIIEDVCTEIEAKVPGSFYRADTAQVAKRPTLKVVHNA